MRIGRYEILDEIGRGSMGTVYQARDPLIDRTVAIKTFSIAQLKQEGADVESRFLREAQSAGRLSHPNIVTIYDVGEVDGLAYIAMEYLSGTTLRDLMDKGPMPLDLALDTAIQMAEALAFAHEHGVIHRDIKPANVIVTDQHGRIKLTDFGIAHLANSEHTLAGQMLGSPRYMSPEQAMGREVDGRSDIFSLGSMLYEMLTGRYAFDGDSLPIIVYRVINDAPVSASSLRPQLPAGLANLLAHMLSKNPHARPDARTLVNALHGLATSAQPATPPSTRIPRLLPTLAFGAPVGVLLLVGVGIIVIEHFLDASLRPPPAPTQVEIREPPVEATPEVPPAAQPPVAEAPPAPPPSEPDPYLVGLDKKRTELRLRRTELLLEYTDRHPDVMQIDRQLDQLRIERRNYLRQKQEN
ncbi:MAG: serine/threonine-protein kinase [Thiobacillus sp.]|uniref:serine/threonine-protein kinase n=1 Tax=Thiobacillus sp. TaxID=924 RepID=UPI002895B705|nr:serine/threonine-protein kinase [Thiobacillus sp.]MDT3708278.1 serine/threonine-protein kinase [Thiobacillus sp.]